jgi:hypothetical protein
MNKIERAIADTKLHIDNLRRDRMILIAEIEAFEKQLSALESIERNKSIPHSNPKIIVDNETILKERWEAWKIDKEKEVYEDDVELAYADGFSRGALWIQEQLTKNK